MAIFAGCLASLASVIVRKLGTSVSPVLSPFYLSLFGTIGNSFYFLLQGSQDSESVSYMHSYGTMGYIFLAALLTMIHYGTMAKALQLEKAGRVGLIGYLDFVFIAMIDIVFFGSSLTILEVIGGFLIISSSFILAVLKFNGVIN